jgi:multicomponent Na+:H+ antiporter subunit F
MMSLAQFVQAIVLPLLGLAVLLCVARIVRGPDLANRVISFDLLSSLGIAVLATYAMVTQQPALLDVGLVLALVTFMGTVAFAHYLERQP